MELEVHGHYGHHFSVTRRGPESGECWELEPGNGYFALRKKWGQNKLDIDKYKGILRDRNQWTWTRISSSLLNMWQILIIYNIQSTKFPPISWNIPGQGWGLWRHRTRAWIGLTNDRCHSDTLFTGLGWTAKNWQTYRRWDPAIDNIVSRAMNKPFRIIINRDNRHQADTIENQAPSVFANRYVWIKFGVNPILIVVLGMKICTRSWYIEQCLYLRRCRYLCYGYQDSYRSAAGQQAASSKIQSLNDVSDNLCVFVGNVFSKNVYDHLLWNIGRLKFRGSVAV